MNAARELAAERRSLAALRASYTRLAEKFNALPEAERRAAERQPCSAAWTRYRVFEALRKVESAEQRIAQLEQWGRV